MVTRGNAAGAAFGVGERRDGSYGEVRFAQSTCID